MEKMQIDSEIGYNRNRVINGHGPHKLLEMLQAQMLEKIARTEVSK